MPVIIAFVFVALVVFVALALVLNRGFIPQTSDKMKRIPDPLTLNVLGPATAHVFLSVPTTEGLAETLPLVVNQSTRELFLRFGPLYFVEAFSEWAHIKQARCLVGTNREQAKQVLLTDLSQRIFGDDEVCESVGLIHAMTEVDFMTLEDEEAIAAHVMRCGFESISQ